MPGEYRADLQRLIVIQGDTEPASVEQQRLLGLTAPSLYDLRNLFQVNVEEGRHLWAMVYLLHAYFGREGREEAEGLLLRNSGSPDSPRILGAFNEETADWLAFFMFTYFTDRDGKYQLGTLKESAFDPLSRTCEFMLKEEAHHMFVGTTGVDRVVERTAQLIREHDTHDIGPHGGDPARRHPEVHQLPLHGLARPVRQRDLDQRGQLLHRRAQGPLAGDAPQGRPPAHRGRRARSTGRTSTATWDGRGAAALVALNIDLRGEYIADCESGVKRWNRILDERRASPPVGAAAPGVQPLGRRRRGHPRHPGRHDRRRGRRGQAGQAQVAADRARTWRSCAR